MYNRPSQPAHGHPPPPPPPPQYGQQSQQNPLPQQQRQPPYGSAQPPPYGQQHAQPPPYSGAGYGDQQPQHSSHHPQQQPQHSFHHPQQQQQQAPSPLGQQQQYGSSAPHGQGAFPPPTGQPQQPQPPHYGTGQQQPPPPFSQSHQSRSPFDQHPQKPQQPLSSYGQMPPSGGYGQSPHLNLGSQHPSSEVRIWFESVDMDRSGLVRAEELKNALLRSSLGGHFSDECAQMMVRMFDRSGNGQIDFGEFEQLYQYLQSMQRAFEMEDVDRSGRLEYNEVCNALRRGGYMLSPQTVQTVFQRFDRKRINSLGLDGYIELCMFLGNARNTFERFDTNRSGLVTFNMDSFVSACTNFV